MVDQAVILLVLTQALILLYTIFRIATARIRTNTSSSPNPIAQIRMEQTQLEISWKLSRYKARTLTLQANVTEQVNSIAYRCFWGVNIETFHHVLQSPWQWFLEAFDRGNLFGSQAYDSLDEKCIVDTSSESSKMLDITVPDLNLGEAPRKKYPLVLVSLALSSSSIIVVHLEDKNFMNLNTHIINSFVKLSDNRVSRLESIFTSEEKDDSCVICYSRPATRVTLPCRHASTCCYCFKRLPKGQCPMCRCKISSYFVVGEENEEEEFEEEVKTSQTWRQKLAQLEQRFAIATGLVNNE